MELIKMAAEDFDLVYSIMEKSFPVTEMRTYEYLKKQLLEPKFQIWLNKEKTTFITVWSFDNFYYIEHFASEPSERGKGTGKEVIEEIIRRSGKTVVLEAEPVETPIQQRRIAFYERAGFKVNSPYFFQPAMREDVEGVELKILSCPNFLTDDEFEEVKNTLYAEVYKISNC